MENEPYDLSPTAAAALIGCHPDTLKIWATEGKVPAFKTPGGWWRFRKSDVEAFLAGRTSAVTEVAS
jgi:excisionase family DNA binding protein